MLCLFSAEKFWGQIHQTVPWLRVVQTQLYPQTNKQTLESPSSRVFAHAMQDLYVKTVVCSHTLPSWSRKQHENVVLIVVESEAGW